MWISYKHTEPGKLWPLPCGAFIAGEIRQRACSGRQPAQPDVPPSGSWVLGCTDGLEKTWRRVTKQRAFISDEGTLTTILHKAKAERGSGRAASQLTAFTRSE